MPEIVAIVVDNGISSQNQDYLPSRFAIQKETITSIINRMFDGSAENKLGIFPTCQEIKNKIITPTGDKQLLYDFIFELDLDKRLDYSLALFQADQALQLSELTTKKMLLFLSSPIEEFGKVLEEISNIATKGITLKIICMGESLIFGEMAREEFQIDHVDFLLLKPEHYVEDEVYAFLLDEHYEDPELKEALQKSMFEK